MSSVTEELRDVHGKNHPTLVIAESWMSYPFKLGVKKAKLVVKYFDEIRGFVEKYERKA